MTYTGNLLLQTTFRIDHISKKSRDNHGERPMYYVENSHEAIIPKETYDAVQAEIKRRSAQRKSTAPTTGRYPFSGLITCGICGRHYRRKMTTNGHAARPVWICSDFNRLGKEACNSKQIPEDILLALTAKTLGIPQFDEQGFRQRVAGLRIPGANRVVYLFRDGHEVEAVWKDKSRRDSWTPEMKQRAREKALQGRGQ